jgi:hypothetical protein
MTLEEIIFEGRSAGIPFFDIYDFTMKEVQEWISVEAEKEKRKMKRNAVVAFYHASFVAKLIAADKKKDYSIYENFPLWDDDEVAEMKVEEYKRRLKASNEKIKAKKSDYLYIGGVENNERI